MEERGPRTFPVDAVVFDCDGVLVDSLESVDRSWRRWAVDLGLDPAEVMTHIHGRPSRDSVSRLVEEGGRKAALLRIDAYEVADAVTVRAVPGAAALLASLPAGRWAIVTSASRELFRARIAAAGLPVPEVAITADDVVSGKPHPEGYVAAMRRLGVDPHRVAIVEDSDGGIAAAIAARPGVVIRVGTGPPRPDEAAVVPDLRSVAWDGRSLVAGAVDH